MRITRKTHPHRMDSGQESFNIDLSRAELAVLFGCTIEAPSAKVQKDCTDF